MKCLIVAPDYAHGSAGVFALHYLMHLLKELGEDVHTTAKKVFYPGILPYRANAGYEMVLVSEVFGGRVSNGPMVRWCCNKPGLLGGPDVYQSNEIVFHYDPAHAELARAAAYDGRSDLFFLPCLKPLPAPRPDKDLVCWYQGKFAHDAATCAQPDLDRRCVPDPDAIRITRSWPICKDETAALLNRCRTLYTFDDNSATNLEAHMLGAKVLMADLAPAAGYTPPADRAEPFEYMWKAYIPPAGPHKYFMEHERDLETVRVFLCQFKARAAALKVRRPAEAGCGKQAACVE